MILQFIFYCYSPSGNNISLQKNLSCNTTVSYQDEIKERVNHSVGILWKNKKSCPKELLSAVLKKKGSH